MTTATLKEITEKIGIKSDDIVTYHEKKGKGIIEVDFKKVHKANSETTEDIDVFENILNMSEHLGIDDLAENHDHYLYGIPKRQVEE